MKIRNALAAALVTAVSMGGMPAQAHDRIEWSVTIGSPGYGGSGVTMVPPTQYRYGAPPSVYVPPPQILPPPQVVYVQPGPVYVLPPPAYGYRPPSASLSVEPWGRAYPHPGHQHNGWRNDRHDRFERHDGDGRRHGGWQRR